MRLKQAATLTAAIALLLPGGFMAEAAFGQDEKPRAASRRPSSRGGQARSSSRPSSASRFLECFTAFTSFAPSSFALVAAPNGPLEVVGTAIGCFEIVGAGFVAAVVGALPATRPSSRGSAEALRAAGRNTSRISSGRNRLENGQAETRHARPRGSNTQVRVGPSRSSAPKRRRRHRHPGAFERQIGAAANGRAVASSAPRDGNRLRRAQSLQPRPGVRDSRRLLSPLLRPRLSLPVLRVSVLRVSTLLGEWFLRRLWLAVALVQLFVRLPL